MWETTRGEKNIRGYIQNYIDQRIRISKNECLKRERVGGVMNEVIVFDPR